MKKMNNKGFSLVELIIVIAIMAILAGAIAPALIRYIDKSRKSNDVSACKTIKTAVETAMANENTYELLTAVAAGSSAGGSIVIKENSDATAAGTITISANTSLASASASEEIGKNIGEKTPKVKYRKDGGCQFIVRISAAGTVNVYITKSGVAASSITDGSLSGTGYWQICPELCEEYQ